MMKTMRVPVLSVGGGGTGLTASMLLATDRIESLVLSVTIFVRPARVITWRSMGATTDPASTLGDVLDRVLARAS